MEFLKLVMAQVELCVCVCVCVCVLDHSLIVKRDQLKIVLLQNRCECVCVLPIARWEKWYMQTCKQVPNEYFHYQMKALIAMVTFGNNK